MTRIVTESEFKVISSKESKDFGEWEIEHIPTQNIVAKISTYSGYGKRTKKLYVNRTSICQVGNQKEALIKLAEFFTVNKEKMKLLAETVVELKKDLDKVNYEQSKMVINKEIERVNKEWDKLSEYNLV